MPAVLSCPRGHQWEDAFDSEPSLADNRCPVCGIELESMGEALRAEAALLPPTRQLQPSKHSLMQTSCADLGEWAAADADASPVPLARGEQKKQPPPPQAGGNQDIATVAGTETEPPPPVNAPSFLGYEVLGELGRGGMGVVYKARQIGLNRLVALKVILGGNHASLAQRRRFQLEAQAVARLHHPNIVQIYDVGERDGHPFFTLELVDGGSLAERFRGPALPPREAARLLAVLAQAIHDAHERGIVHRDLKPGNVLLARDGTPKITDFGLAKLVDDAEANTRSGAVLGTPSYMAPEQAMGQNRTVGPAADIYALGSILYEALTGRPPFRGENSMDVLIQLASDDPAPPSRVRSGMPRDLETICLKCLEKDPRKRYASALALAEDLQRFLGHEPICARPTTSWERCVKWIKRRPTKAALVGCLFLVAVALAVQAVQAANRARTERGRLENARAEVRDVLLRAQEAVKGQAWDAAEELLTSAESKIDAEPALGDLAAETGELISFVRGRLAAHKTLQQFSARRDEALFHATLAMGEGTGDDLRAVRDKAREALALMGMDTGSADAGHPGGWSLDASFTASEKDEIRERSYELLLVLAEAEGQSRPSQSAAEQRSAAGEALRLLDLAAALDLRTKAYHLRRARFLDMAGQRDAASQEAKQAEQLPARSALDHYLLGDELYRQGNPQQARDEFQLTLRAQPDHFWARYFLALCYIRLQKADLARDNLTVCLSQHQEMVWIHLMRGFALGQLEEYQAAEDDFAQALRLLDQTPNDDARYVLYNNRAVMRVGQKNFDGALGDLRRAIALRPGRYQAYASLAQTLHSLKRPDEAIGQLDEAIKAAEPLVRSQEVEAATLALLYRARARFQREQKRNDAALADLERAVAWAPAESLLLARAQVERGQLLHLAGRLEPALAAYEAAVQAQPHHAPAHLGRGEALFGLKRYEESIEALTAYLKNDGRPLIPVYQARALAHIRLGDPKSALDDLTLALQLDGNNATLLTQRGQAFLACQSDQQRLALDDFDRAIACKPNNGPAYSGRARARLELGQVALALADADKALELGPRTAHVVYGVAAVYARAVGKLDASGERPTRADLERRRRYHEQALALLAQAIPLLPEEQRATFWRDTVQRDIAFAAVRNSIEFARLRRTYASGRIPPSAEARPPD